MQEACMTLQQHLGNAGTAAEVAVNLEGGMCIEHIGIGTTVSIFHGSVGIHQAQLILDDVQRMVAVEHTCPLTYLPTH